MRFLIFFITFSISGGFALAQSNCVENLKKAQDAFEAGRIEEIPAFLSACLENEFNKEQKGLAYKLLAITYLYDKDEAKADEAMLELLHADPLFKPDLSNDPSEFISLYNSFRTNPVLKVGFSVGATFFSIREVGRYGVENLNSEADSYTGKWGINLGLDLEIPLRDQWAIFTSARFANKKYDLTNSLMDYNELEVQESQTWMDFFIMGQFYFTSGNLQPYVRLGGYGGYLISAQASYFTNQENINDIEGPQENIKELRSQFNYGPAADLGVAYSFGRNVIDFSVRIAYSVRNYALENSRYNTLGDKLALTYGYRDNDLYANFLNATAGYKIMIFNPKKLRQ